MSRTCAARLQDFVTAVGDLVAGAPVKPMDETGFRIGGQTQWLANDLDRLRHELRPS